MDHLADLKKRAAKHASWGNYWAGKVLALLDENEKLRAEVERLSQRWYVYPNSPMTHLGHPATLAPSVRQHIVDPYEEAKRINAERGAQ